MDLSHYLRRSRRESSDPEDKVNHRSVLYKAKGNRQVKKARDAKKNEWKEKRNTKLHQLRGIAGGGGEVNESMSSPAITTLSKEKLKCSKAGSSSSKSNENKQTEILNRLAEYRLRKQEMKAMEAKGKKPAFKVGVVHHEPYPLLNPEIPKNFKFNRSICPQSLKKSSQKNHLPISPSSNDNPVQETEDCLNNDINMETPPQKENIVNHVPIERPPINRTPFKPPLPTLAEENEEGSDIFKAPYPSTPSSRLRRKSSVSPLIDGLRTDICFKRGTSSDIRRAKKGLPSELTSPFDNIFREIDHAKLSGKSLEDELGVVAHKEDPSIKKDVSIFRKLYADNVDKLVSLSDIWENVEAPDEELKGRLSATVGKARLIISKKGRLQQFSNLVDNCEFGRGEKETNTEDLRGFWDMILYQIEGIYDEFEKISILKANNWKSKEEVVEPTIKQSPKPLKKLVPPKTKKAKASSGLMAMLKAKRSQMKNETTSSTLSISPDNESYLKDEECKNFDGGFFQVSSPVKETIKSNPSPKMSSMTPRSSTSSYLRKSILMNSVMKVSSSARRSICILDESTDLPKIYVNSNEVVHTPPKATSATPKRRSSRRLSSFNNNSVINPIDKVNNKPGNATSTISNQENDVETQEDLISFETPIKSVTPRRSKRLSSRLTPINYN